jgi:hypothetical protein
MSCGAHRVLGVRRGGGSAAATLLGLTDDVDCAVVQLAIARGDAAAGVEQPPAGAASEQQQGPSNSGQAHHHGPRISATHVVSIPALAYVAAGKTQRKALLLAPPGDAGRSRWPQEPEVTLHVHANLLITFTPFDQVQCSKLASTAGGRIAAALVEAQTFAYVYAATDRRQQTGGNALLELQDTADGAEVMGAALLASRAKTQLLVLFADELKMFQLQNE